MPVDDPAFSDELVESRDYVSAAVRRAAVPGSAYRVTDHLGANHWPSRLAGSGPVIEACRPAESVVGYDCEETPEQP
jgi:hypothetical protein